MARRLSFLLASILLIPGPAPAHEEPRPRLLTVTGSGDVSVVPDRADVGLAVEASEKTLADAEKNVADGVARLLKLCDGLEIPRNQVRSAQSIVQPQYDEGSLVSGGRPRIVGYIVSRQVEIDLRDLSRLGRLLQGAVESGANRITGTSFGSSKKEEHQRAALAKAADDAQASAQVLAKSLGVKLGRLHSLSANESGGEPQPLFYQARMKSMAAEAPAAATYEAGEIRFSASVTADFDLP
jgi:uncharacterized protein YggE